MADQLVLGFIEVIGGTLNQSFSDIFVITAREVNNFTCHALVAGLSVKSINQFELLSFYIGLS